MSNYFFTADTHFNHFNIMRYCERPFGSLEEMNEAIIENWNKIVTHKDYIYHLGDFGLGDCRSIFNRLNGRKYLIKGNHDRNPTLKFPWVWVKDTAMIEINSKYIWLSHYAHRSWNRSFHGSWHLYGHTHGKLLPHGRSFDCGIDGHNFSPWSLEEVKNRMKKLEGVVI